MTRLAAVHAAILTAPEHGHTLPEILDHSGITDGGTRQIAPLAWWLHHTGRIQMSRDGTRYRPLTAETHTDETTGAQFVACALCGEPCFTGPAHGCCLFWAETIAAGRACPACAVSRAAERRHDGREKRRRKDHEAAAS